MKLTYTSVFSYLRLAVAGTLVVAAVGLGLSSLSVQSPRQFGEHQRGSAAFLKHTEDLFAAKVGASGEKAASWADQNYQLNGGVRKTDKALGGGNWVNVSDGSFQSGAIGALTYDAAHSILYAGTGEDAAAGDAEAGVGVYKSIDGGANWTALGGNSSFTNRAIRTIAIDNLNDATGNTIYVTSGRGVHGISSTTAGAISQIPGGPGVGVWKSTDGGANFTLAQPTTVVLGPNPGQTFPSSFGSTRGATALAVDPTHAGVIYATAYQKGVWRSTDSGANWTQIHPSLI